MTNSKKIRSHIKKKNLEAIKEKGWTFYVGPEIEYFYFGNNQSPEILDREGYFDYTTVDIGTQLRKQTVGALEDIGIPVECSHHEVAPSQHEIDLKYQEALVMADFSQVYKFIVKEVAMENNYYATFMPKPMFGQNGSGMHCHMSLFNGDKNLFFDKEHQYHLSEISLLRRRQATITVPLRMKSSQSHQERVQACSLP